ncbi:hypothetical protein Tco_0882355 [Tanacetum coccineum]
MSSSSSIPPTECKCRLPLMMLTSWTRENPARRFGVFPNKYKKGIKHCKRWHWSDSELENKRYKDHLYEMHLLLNPPQREELENELLSLWCQIKPVQGFDDDDILGVLSLDSRFNAKKVICGLMYRRGSPDDGNVVLCVCK